MTTTFKIFDGSRVEVFFANATVADNTKFPMYWARPIIGERRQVAVVRWTATHTTVIDNTCGQAMVKLEEGWYPNRPHRDLAVKESIEELFENRLHPSQWNKYDYQGAVAEAKRLEVLENEFYKDNPEHERFQRLKAATKSPKMPSIEQFNKRVKHD